MESSRHFIFPRQAIGGIRECELHGNVIILFNSHCSISFQSNKTVNSIKGFPFGTGVYTFTPQERELAQMYADRLLKVITGEVSQGNLCDRFNINSALIYFLQTELAASRKSMLHAGIFFANLVNHETYHAQSYRAEAFRTYSTRVIHSYEKQDPLERNNCLCSN